MSAPTDWTGITINIDAFPADEEGASWDAAVSSIRGFEFDFLLVLFNDLGWQEKSDGVWREWLATASRREQRLVRKGKLEEFCIISVSFDQGMIYHQTLQVLSIMTEPCILGENIHRKRERKCSYLEDKFGSMHRRMRPM